MAFAISPADWVRIASGALMVVVGALLMRVGRGGRSETAAGIGLLFVGAGIVGLFTNFESDEALPWVANALAATVGYGIGLIAVMRLLRAAGGPRWAKTYGALGGALALAAGSGVLLAGMSEWTPGVFALLAASPYGTSSFYAGFLSNTTFFALFLVLGLAWARRGIPGMPSPHAQAVAAALMAWPMWATIHTARTAFSRISPARPVLENAGLVLLLLAFVPLVLWTVMSWSRRGPAAWVSLALPLLVASLLVASAAFGDIGAAGITRLLGAAVVAYLVLRRDALQLGLRAGTIQRGGIATILIASLLIVAQIAQNFLSAQYGLLMGGVVAGALLVAARPIERALEGRTTRSLPIAASDERSSLYRDLARRLLADGGLSRDDERRLARLAHQLAMHPDEALRIRHEVEDELRAPRS